MGSTSSSVSSGWSDSDDIFYDTESSFSFWSPSPPSSCAERSISESELYDSEVLMDDMVFYTVSSLPPYKEKVTVRSRRKRRMMNQTPQEPNHEVVENGGSEHDHKTSSNPAALVGSVDTAFYSSSSQVGVACSTLRCSESSVTSNIPRVSPLKSEKSEAGEFVSDAVPQGKKVRRLTEEVEDGTDQAGLERPTDCEHTEGRIQGDDRVPEHDMTIPTRDPITDATDTASISSFCKHMETARTAPHP